MTATTARYPNGTLGCTFQVGDDRDMTCDAPAQWVEAEFIDPDGGPMLRGWFGDAWCDEHRPENGRSEP